MDAERMDLGDDTIDGALCRWGYMLMADPAAGDPASNEWASAPAAAYAEHTGAEPADPRAPGIFAMASEERTRELLGEASLEPVRMAHVEMEWAFDTPDDHWHYVMDLAGALAMLIRALPEEDQAAIRRRTEERLEAVVRRPGYNVAGLCLNVLAE